MDYFIYFFIFVIAISSFGAIFFIIFFIEIHPRILKNKEIKNARYEFVSLSNEVINYTNKCNEIGHFPLCHVANINLIKDEFALLSCNSVLHEVTTIRSGNAVGTRVKIGKIPLYLGKYSSSTTESLKEVSSGILCLTNKRIIFVGNYRSQSTDFKHLIGFENSLHELQINTIKSKKPLIYSVDNAVLWAVLLPLVVSNELKDPYFSDEQKIYVKPNNSDFTMDISFSKGKNILAERVLK